MKSMAKTVASKVMSFAHLAGISAKAEDDGPGDDPKKKDDDESAKGAKAEGDDDERKKRDDESDDEYAARMAAMDDDEAAADDAPEKKDDDEDDKSKSKAEDDDKDEEMRGKSAAAQARLREQARCAAIFSHKAAAAHPVVAANLAFTTRMSRSEALAVLDGLPAKAMAPGHAGRAARNPSGIAGASTPSLTGAQAQAARWDENLARASGKRK